MAWWTDFQRGYRMARRVEQYLQARAQARADFRRELADLDPAGRPRKRPCAPLGEMGGCGRAPLPAQFRGRS